ncbi:MAG: hypothetical protein ACRCV9_15245 [Burkholderiaceae bacterium]
MEVELLACNVDAVRVLMQCRFVPHVLPGKVLWQGLDTEWLKLALQASQLAWTESLSAQVRQAESAMLKWLNR